MRRVLLFLASALAAVACSSSGVDSRAVIRSVRIQMEVHPESRLQDLYKSFFQDRFGPGHMISDRESAMNHILSELGQADSTDAVFIEPCGWQHNYVRVNLSSVRLGLISAEELTDALMESAVPVTEGEIASWQEEWRAVLAIIEKHFPDITDLQQDSRRIDSLLCSGQYACHHSRAYNEAYKPHYRIIKKEIAEKALSLFP